MPDPEGDKFEAEVNQHVLHLMERANFDLDRSASLLSASLLYAAFATKVLDGDFAQYVAAATGEWRRATAIYEAVDTGDSVEAVLERFRREHR